MALVVVVISVEIYIWAVIGGCYQGEGPVVVVGVQWFLLNADVMPGGKEHTNLSVLLSLTVIYPPPHPFNFFYNFTRVQEQNKTELSRFCL